jgi:hypothetical protein
MLVGCSRAGEPMPQAPELSAALEAALDPVEAHSTAEVRRVLFTASVIGVAGPRGVTLELLSPSGDVYERQVETLFGSAFDVQRVEFDLPVAGTFIDQSGLAGMWTARLNLGDEPVALDTFELQP